MLFNVLALLAAAAAASATSAEGEPYLRRLMTDKRLIMIVK